MYYPNNESIKILKMVINENVTGTACFLDHIIKYYVRENQVKTIGKKKRAYFSTLPFKY